MNMLLSPMTSRARATWGLICSSANCRTYRPQGTSVVCFDVWPAGAKITRYTKSRATSDRKSMRQARNENIQINIDSQLEMCIHAVACCSSRDLHEIDNDASQKRCHIGLYAVVRCITDMRERGGDRIGNLLGYYWQQRRIISKCDINSLYTVHTNTRDDGVGPPCVLERIIGLDFRQPPPSTHAGGSEEDSDSNARRNPLARTCLPHPVSTVSSAGIFTSVVRPTSVF
jgi:hypothetical protein